jgi:hypothetical protein
VERGGRVEPMIDLSDSRTLAVTLHPAGAPAAETEASIVPDQ